ncbi:hypothetical protein MUK70_25590 [Dyadobacter chenwenxiniae]|uniref:Alpha 1,4-glycosyltransferase domain-containing protein n=1 Tax=Dyadobacter chenwenxiniae TaxID=2906456 RepID=A0A9X1PP84_9BACT|nr:glycosyltransferase [Dyadobacter chenwenxiniae]MCF0064396.1 hypothetical protein [Dyadobacter chenwenxiniae]UON82398.1 hypothetical protein MUK70_25590 [Dyadobacter chenwenxiniae]
MKFGNEIVQSLWIGDSLSTMEQLSINSYLKNGHEFHLYSYDKIRNVPEGTILKDANSILSKDRIFKDSRNLYAAFSDWFRYRMLYENGGWWVDLDSVCVQFFDVEEDYCFATEYFYKDRKVPTLNVCNLKVPQEAEIIQDCLIAIEDRILKSKVVPWGSCGPFLFREIIRSYDASPFIKAPHVFCPIPWFNYLNFINESANELDQETLAIHLYNGAWSSERVDKDASYRADSLFESLKAKYLNLDVIV